MTTEDRAVINPDLIDVIARATHEANRAYCLWFNDKSQPSWDEAPDWQKSSARNGVAGAIAGATPEQSHESWLAEKVATGWKYGEVKDPEKKEHPCMVPYSELPPQQRAKDAIFTSVARTMARALRVLPPEAEVPSDVAGLAKEIASLKERLEKAEARANDAERRYKLHVTSAR